MDQSNRYARLDLKEAELISGGTHVLCAYIMKAKPKMLFMDTNMSSAIQGRERRP